MTIYDAIKRYFKIFTSEENFYSKVGVVVSVDETKRVIEFEPLDGAKMTGVRLQASINQTKGFIQIPKVNSKVIVTYLDSATGFVSTFTEVDKILIDTDLVQFNGGDNDGMVLINELVTELKKAQSDLNDLKLAFTTWVPVPQDGGAALKTATTTWAATTIIESTKNDIENTKITQ